MNVDMDLGFNSVHFRKNLMKDMTALNHGCGILEMEPYPSPLVLAKLASAVYNDGGESEDIPDGWKILTTVFNNSWGNGYFGATYWSPSLQQVVVAHRGTKISNLGALLTDLNGIVSTNYTQQMNSAITFTDMVMREILPANQKNGVRLQVSVTGHSLGGWLTQITAFTLKHAEMRGDRFVRVHDPRHDRHVHAVTFDSPGCADMLNKIINDGYHRYGRAAFSDDLDITNYLAPPNRINTAGSHVGTVLVVHLDVSRYTTMDKLSYSSTTHQIKNFVEAFEGRRAIREVLDWPVSSGPLGGGEYAIFHARASQEEGYIPDPEEEVQVTWELKLRYKTKEVDNSCNLRVFSEKELYLLHLWSTLNLETLKMDVIDAFVKEYNLMKGDLFPEFEIDDKSHTMTCRSESELQTAVRRTKLLMRWLREEFTEAVELQTERVPRAGALKYQMATRNYLEALPDCHLHFEDTIGLEAFLESRNDRILQIFTEDSQFEVVRLRDLLSQLREVRQLQHLGAYLSEASESFMDLKQIKHLERTIDIEKLYNSEFHFERLIVLDCASTEDISPECQRFLKRILNNVQKKLVCVLSPQNVYESLLASFNTPVTMVSCGSARLTDLTKESQQEIFQRKMLIVDGEELSWADYAGIQNLSSFFPFFNSFIDSEMFKRIVTNRQYTIRVNNPHSNHSLVHSSVVSSELSVARLATVVQAHSPEALLVIKGIGQEELSTGEWRKLLDVVGGDAEKRIFTTAENGDATFKQKCRENPCATIFGLAVSAGRINRTHLYRKEFYMERQFHQRIIFDVRKFALKDNVDGALFVFQNETDKKSLTSLLPEETRGAFSKRENVRTAASAKEADDIVRENPNKSVHVMQREASSGLLLWQRSRGSLAGLRPLVTAGAGDPKSERDLCHTNQKIVIIADEPGMGKSTSLRSMSRLLRSSWLIWIDLKDFKIPFENLPTEPRERCEFLLRENLNQDSWLRGLLHFCLHHQHLRQVCIMLDGFDEIKKDFSSRNDAKSEVIKLLHYLCNETTARVWVTTRLHERESLEDALSTFSVTFKKIDEQQQRQYLVDFWRSHLLLELEDCSDSTQSKFEDCAQMLYTKAKEDLGEGIQSFMGVPLQMRMLADAFLEQVEDFVKSESCIENVFEVKSSLSLYEKFIHVKYNIYFKAKTGLNAGMSCDLYDMNVRSFTETHRMLALRTLFPQFAEEHYDDYESPLGGAELCRIGLVQSGEEGSENVEFIHRTLAEYFCADQIVHWFSNKGRCRGRAPTVELLLTDILLQDSNKIIRVFIDGFLRLRPTSDTAREYTASQIGKLWEGGQHLLFNRLQQTALHVAVEENNEGIVDLLFGGIKSEPAAKGLISFVAAHDRNGNTALGLAPQRTMEKLLQTVDTCASEIKLELLLATYIKGHPLKLLTEYLKEDNVKMTEKSICSETKAAFIRTQKILRVDVPPFLEAVEERRRGDVEILYGKMENDIVRHYVLFAPDRGGNTAIHIAAQNAESQIEVISFLCNRNIPGIERSYNARGDTPLHCAAAIGHLDILKHLVRHSVRVDCLNLLGQTALHTAAAEGRLPVVEWLAAQGAAVDCADKAGHTALHRAAERGHLSVVEFLVEEGAENNSVDILNRTALHMAAKKGHLPVVAHLVEKEADINCPDRNGRTALHRAAEEGNLRMVQYLVKKGVDIHSVDKFGRTVVHIAAQNGKISVMEYLLENGSRIDTLEVINGTTLRRAARKGDLTMVQYLIEKGVDVNSADEFGNTSLHAAALMGRLPVVEYLVNKGINGNSVDTNGQAAVHVAAKRGHRGVVEYLVEKGMDVT